MIKIDADILKKFLNRFLIGKNEKCLITEAPFKVHEKSIEILTVDPSKQVVIHGFLNMDINPNIPCNKPVDFSVPSLPKLFSIISEFNGEIDLEVNNGYLKISNKEKKIKTNVIESNLYEAIMKTLSVSREGNMMNLKIRSEEVVYDDFMRITGGEMKKGLDQCKVAKSPFFYLDQINNEVFIMTETKTESVELKLKPEKGFSKDKGIWLIEFTREIFKNNKESLEIFVRSKEDPVLISSNSPQYMIHYVIAPKG